MKKSAHTHEDFINKVSKVNPTILITGQYAGVEKKIEIECKHGKGLVYAYSLLKTRNCCRKGYFETRLLHNIKDISQRLFELTAIFGNSIDLIDAKYNDSRDKLLNLKCVKHQIIFDQWISSLTKGIGCPTCGKEHKHNAGVRMLKVARQKQLELGSAKYVSKAETQWLDLLGVPVRQQWLHDVQYSVDGYDPDTNTVYLYHGRFWHGCLETYKADDIHPILKVKMKQLNDQTIIWENKIKHAGYNLIVKWGK